jgi:hypothetical protein
MLQVLHTPDHALDAPVVGLDLLCTDADLLTDLQSSFVALDRADSPSGIQENQASAIVCSEPDDPASVLEPGLRSNGLHGFRILGTDPLKRLLDPGLLGLLDPAPGASFEVFADENPATSPHLLALAESLEYGAAADARRELSDAREDFIDPSELVWRSPEAILR